MKLVAVGGHSRDIGKTSLLCGLIAATRRLDWTAAKLAQFGHGICSENGKPCGCAVDDPDHPFSIDEETAAGPHADTRRMLAAGARRALWVRAPQDALDRAMPSFEATVAGDAHVIVESNTLLDHRRPDFYAVVLDFRVADFKASCRRHLEKVDAFAVVESDAPPWEWFDRSLLERKPVFPVAAPNYMHRGIADLMLSALAEPGSAPASPRQSSQISAR